VIEVLEHLHARGEFVAEHLTIVEEDVRFTLPRELTVGRNADPGWPSGA
jgi:hypothetical protein